MRIAALRATLRAVGLLRRRRPRPFKTAKRLIPDKEPHLKPVKQSESLLEFCPVDALREPL